LKKKNFSFHCLLKFNDYFDDYNICKVILPSIKKRNKRLFKRFEDFTFVADTFFFDIFLLMINVNAAITLLEKRPENIFRL